MTDATISFLLPIKAANYLSPTLYIPHTLNTINHAYGT